MWILRDHILKFLKWQRDMFWYWIQLSKFSLVECKNLGSSDKCFDKFWLCKLSPLATWNSGTKRWWYLGQYMSLSKLLTLCKLIMKQIWRAREPETLWLGDRVAKMYLARGRLGHCAAVLSAQPLAGPLQNGLECRRLQLFSYFCKI